MIVNDGQHPEAAAIGEGIADKVQAPALVGSIGHEHRPPSAQGPFAAAALADLKPLLAIELPELLKVLSAGFAGGAYGDVGSCG